MCCVVFVCVCVRACVRVCLSWRAAREVGVGGQSAFFSDYMNEAPPEWASCVRAIKTKPGPKNAECSHIPERSAGTGHKACPPSVSLNKYNNSRDAPPSTENKKTHEKHCTRFILTKCSGACLALRRGCHAHPNPAALKCCSTDKKHIHFSFLVAGSKISIPMKPRTPQAHFFHVRASGLLCGSFWWSAVTLSSRVCVFALNLTRP